jgi:transcriptional regulator GlxA family with amidase domain
MKSAEAIVRGATWWPDPRCVVPGEADEGFTALLDSLHATGPRNVPTREEAAGLSSLGVSTFRRKFPRWAGMTWQDFLTAWRMECGRARLRTTHLLTKQIHRECGYRSEQGFARAYHKHFGEFPRGRKHEPD